MDTTLFFMLLFLLGIGYLFLGLQSQEKSLHSKENYFLSGRNLGVFALATSIVATQLGGGTLMGAAQEAYTHGWWVLFYPMGACLGLITLSFGIGSRWNRLQLSTVSELFERIYGSSFLRQLSSVLSIISLLLILVGQGIAARQFLSTIMNSLMNPITLGFFPISDIIFIVFWCVLIIYTTLGGLDAVVKTDIAQTLFIVSALLLAATAMMNTPAFQSESLFNSSSFSENLNFTQTGLNWLLLPFLFMLIEQDMGQRCFAAKSSKTITRATLFASITMLTVVALPIGMGIYGKHLGITESPSLLIETVQASTNPKITAIFACAILMAIISTADSLLCSISSNLSFDFPSLGKDEKNKVKWSQAITASIGIISLALSWHFDKVVSLLMLSYELSVSLLFIPIFIPLISTAFPSKISSQSAYQSIISAFIGYGLHKGLICIGIATHIPTVLICLPLALIGFYVKRRTFAL